MKNEVLFDDGKYKIVKHDKGTEALRYDEKWRDLTGDNLIGALLNRIEELEEKFN